MYTQCPDCGISFRVTAVVLKQAAGKVRCGGCGNAFNALAYLSESKPDPETRIEPDGSLPELKPDPVETSSDKSRQSISPEQSAALLKTLDQLAGDDIRLEDTGIEWRVVSDDEDSGVDELLEHTPTKVDQFLTKTPTEVEAGEIFDDPVPSGVEAVEVFEGADTPATQTSAEELRFDDNTGLPEDFDFDEARPAAAAAKAQPEPEPDPTSTQADLAFGDPDEWGELLGEVVPELKPEPEPESIADSDEILILGDDLGDEALIAADDKPPDIDTQFGLQAEAMGIDLSGIYSTVDDESDEAVDEDGIQIPDSTGALEFELARAQAAAEELDANGDAEADADTSIEEDLMAAAFEKERTAAEELDKILDEDLDEEFEEDQEDVTVLQDLELDVIEDIDTEEPIAELDGKFDEDIENLTISLGSEADDVAELEAANEHAIPAPTEEEDSLNLQIDQELLSMAVEDEDGFASTIVIEDKRKIEDAALARSDEEMRAKEAALLEKLKDTGSGFEAIVMEGDVVRSELEQERLNEELEASGARVKPAFVLPKEVPSEEPRGNSRTYGMIAGGVALLLLLGGQLIHQSRAELATIPSINNAIGPIYRALGAPITPNWNISGWRIEVSKGSTNPIAEFVDGEPQTALDTDVEMVDDAAGIVGGDDEMLTIYSRIGNESEGPLPYPLISVALTDRFEETIGSTVLEPHQYLTGIFDPRVPVPTGITFNAVISIESPAADATGFKLNVCYRNSDGLLRCAIESFK